MYSWKWGYLEVRCWWSWDWRRFRVWQFVRVTWCRFSGILGFWVFWVRRKLLELFEDIENVAFDQELDEDVLDSNFLDCFLESGIGQDYIITVAVNEQNVLVLYFRVTPGNASVFQVLPLVPVVQLNLTNSIFLLLPLRGYQGKHLLMVRFRVWWLQFVLFLL